MTFQFKIILVLLVVIICNVTFVLLSYLCLENNVPERPGIMIPTTPRLGNIANIMSNDVTILGSTPSLVNNPIGGKHSSTTTISGSSSSSSSSSSSTVSVWLAGIILDAIKIQPHIWESLIRLNCQHNIGIHIIAKYNTEEATQVRNDYVHSFKYEDKTNGYEHERKHKHKQCAPFIIYDQGDNQNIESDIPLKNNEIRIESNNDGKVSNKGSSSSSSSSSSNRIDRLSHLRDFQRNILHKEIFVNKEKQDGDIDEGVIILADLDLYQFPSIKRIINQIQRLRIDKVYPHDAVCAMGTTINFGSQIGGNEIRKKKKKLIRIPFYYDTFATVFLPDTFSHPLSRRLISHNYPNEDPKLVRSNDQVYGNFTQAHIWNYFMEKGKELLDNGSSSSSTHTRSGNVPVKSCFGGMAMYKSSVYFNMRCQYELKREIINQQRMNDTSIMKYASSKEERPCEHVVFHDCLSGILPTFAIAVNPLLQTLWRRDT